MLNTVASSIDTLLDGLGLRRARCRHGVGVNEVSRGMVRQSPNVFDQALKYINTPNYSDVMELRAW